MSSQTRQRQPVAVVACGALALHLRAIARRRRLPIDIHPLSPALHNRPERIAPAVQDALERLDRQYERIAVAFADCGTRGQLDEALAERGIARLSGDTCYDVLALEEVRQALAEEPGTYFLTDFLVRTFERSVVRPLGLDRYPELRDAYFGNYRRVLWLAQRPTLSLRDRARAAAERLGLPLEERLVGEAGLERQLEELVSSRARPAALPPRKKGRTL
ncbi:MAG: hypothetical protein C4306_05530 [Thermoleophilia bacterium]